MAYSSVLLLSAAWHSTAKLPIGMPRGSRPNSSSPVTAARPRQARLNWSRVIVGDGANCRPGAIPARASTSSTRARGSLAALIASRMKQSEILVSAALSFAPTGAPTDGGAVIGRRSGSGDAVGRGGAK